MKEKLVQVQLQSVTMPSIETGPLALLQDVNSDKSIQISIGAFEAGSIIMHMEGLNSSRPRTHSLLAGIMKEQGLSIKSVEIYGMTNSADDNFFARLNYRKGLKNWSREICASDALALAIETNTPVYIHPALLDSAFPIFAADSDSHNAYIWHLGGSSQLQHKELI